MEEYSNNLDAPKSPAEKIMLLFQHGNFYETYKMASDEIETNTISNQLGDIWVFMGLSKGYLSTHQQSYIKDMISDIKKGIDLGISILTINEVATQIAQATNHLNGEILKYYLGLIANIGNQPNPTIIVPQPSKSISESIGTGLGAGIGVGIAKYIIVSRETQELSLKLGVIFQRDFQYGIINAVEYAWRLAPNLKVAILIIDLLGKVFTTKCFLFETKLAFFNEVSPLIDWIKSKYPNLSLPPITST